MSERSSPILINHTEEQPGSYTLNEETILWSLLRVLQYHQFVVAS